MASGNDSQGFSGEAETVPDHIPQEEVNGSGSMEGPRDFVSRQEREEEARRGDRLRDYEERVHRGVQQGFMEHINKGEPLRGALSDFSRDVAQRILGQKGTMAKGYTWRIDPENRKPEKR